MGFSLVSFLVLTFLGVFDPSTSLGGAQLMLVNTGITTVGWLSVTFLTKPEAHLRAFYERTRPGGIGWRAFATRTGLPLEAAAFVVVVKVTPANATPQSRTRGPRRPSARTCSTMLPVATARRPNALWNVIQEQVRVRAAR